MSAIFFGSIGAIAETSELQRQSFNQAFANHGLDWQWSRVEYAALLEQSGGRKRVNDYAHSLGQTVDAEAIHRAKSEIFQQLLAQSQLKPRAGVSEVMQQARRVGMKLALVTTTSPPNVAAILDALPSAIAAHAFDVVVTSADVAKPKPFGDAYLFALAKLREAPYRCVAIEDNGDGVKAAQSAGIACVAFPGENTLNHDFQMADLHTSHLNLDDFIQLLASRSAA